MGIKTAMDLAKADPYSLCKKIRVTIRTGMLNPEEAKYANGGLVELPYPTNDARLMTKAATEWSIASSDRT